MIGFFRNSKSQEQKAKIFLLSGLLFIVIGLHLWSLMRYPAVYADEAWLTSRAWGFAKTGHQFGMLDSGLVEKFDSYWIINQWLITVLHSLVLRLAQSPSLLALRLFSFAVGCALLVVNYFIALRFFKDKIIAIFCTLVLSASVPFLFSSHLVRYDILAATFGYCALAIVLNDPEGKLFPGVIAGLLTGLAVETHLNSIIFIPAVGVVIIFQYGWQFWRKKIFWGYIIGDLVGLVYYLSLHFFPNPNTFLFLSRTLFSDSHISPIFSGSISIIVESITQTGNLLFLTLSSSIFIIVPAVIVMLKRKEKDDYLLLAINITMVLSMVCFIPHKTALYAIYIAPIFLLLVSAFFLYSFRLSWRRRLLYYLNRIIVLGSLIGMFVISGSMLIKNRWIDYQNDLAKIENVIKPGEKLIGHQNYWFGFIDHTYLSWETLFLYSRFFPESDLQDAFFALQPDIFIIDNDVSNLISDKIASDSYWYNYHISKMELDTFITHYGEKILETTDETGSTLLVYRFHYH